MTILWFVVGAAIFIWLVRTAAKEGAASGARAAIEELDLHAMVQEAVARKREELGRRGNLPFSKIRVSRLSLASEILLNSSGEHRT